MSEFYPRWFVDFKTKKERDIAYNFLLDIQNGKYKSDDSLFEYLDKISTEIKNLLTRPFNNKSDLEWLKTGKHEVENLDFVWDCLVEIKKGDQFWAPDGGWDCYNLFEYEVLDRFKEGKTYCLAIEDERPFPMEAVVIHALLQKIFEFFGAVKMDGGADNEYDDEY